MAAAAPPATTAPPANLESLGGVTLRHPISHSLPSSSRRRTVKQSADHQRSKDSLHLLKDALHLLDRQSFHLDPEGYAVLLKSCSGAEFLRAGQFIHEHISVDGYEHLTFLCNHLIEMYGRCGALNDARFLFDGMAEPNVFSWTILMTAYVHHGCFQEAYDLFLQMQLKGAELNAYAFSTVLGSCTSHGGLAQGRHIHACAVHYGFDSDLVVGTALVNMYGKCRSGKEAGIVFHKLPQYDVVAWNAMIALLIQHGDGKAALALFHKMLHEGLEMDKVTFASTLGACVNEGYLEEGNAIHANIIGFGYISDLIITNSLIDMYAKCGSPCSAGAVFNKAQHRDVVSWTATISAHMQHPREALQIFQRMLSEGFMPNEFTYASILTACASLKTLRIGQIAHHCLIEAGLELNVVVATALIGMYSKCILLKEASWIFNQAYDRDLVLWNAIVAMYAQHGLGKEALEVLKQMQQDSHTPDDITLTSVLSACGHAGLVDEGCGIYAAMGEEYDILPSVEHCGCMVDLFGRACLLGEAQDFIESMHLTPNSVVWEILVGACRIHNHKSGIEYGKNIIAKLARKNAIDD